MTRICLISFSENRCAIIIWIGVLLLFAYPGTYGQATGDVREDFLFGEFYLSEGKFSEALPFYISALENEPDNCNFNYRVGLCYTKILGEQGKALYYLEKAVQEINVNYVDGKYKETGAPIEAWILLGDAYHRDNQLTKASYAYHKYREYIPAGENDRMDMINKRIEGLGISYEYQREEQDIRIYNLSDVINSRFSDYNPVLSADQKTLIYTQYWESYDKIMVSYRTPSGWTQPLCINDEIGSEGDCYSSSVSADGTELLLIKYGDFNYNIYSSKLADGHWSIMQPMQGKINTKYRESSVCFSPDGKYIYFSSDRPGGNGGFDIYRADKQGDFYNNEINLGKIINTENDEEGPFLSADGKTLYFSSNGHETIGNMDILYSLADDNGNWQPPVNLGQMYNTTNDDLFISYFNNTNTAYISRDLPSGLGKNDIYVIQKGDDPRFFEEDLRELQTDAVVSGDLNEPEVEDISMSGNLNEPEVEMEPSMSTSVSINEGVVEEMPSTTSISNTNLASVSILPLYTIQIIALLHPVQPSYFNLKPLTVSPGTDGFTRYTYGEFRGYSEAAKKLQYVHDAGFKRVFIRNVNSISNYNGKH